MKKIKKVEKFVGSLGQVSVFKDKKAVVAKFNKRVVSVETVDKENNAKLQFKFKTKDAGSPSVFHSTEEKGKVKVSTVYLSRKAIVALHVSLSKYLELSKETEREVTL